MPDLRKLRELIKPSNTDNGDGALSACKNEETGLTCN